MPQFGERIAQAGGRAVKSLSPKFGQAMEYGDAKNAAGSEEASVRLDLAKRDDLQPEVLYFLAEDNEADVRRAVAENAATLRQADALLVNDVDGDMRISLAPDLNTEAQGWLQEMTLKILDDLLRDELPRVRTIIA